MTEVKLNLDFKKKVVESFKKHKEEVLKDFSDEERSRLDQVANEDMDNRHIDSKNEETLSEMDFLTHSMEILEKEIYIFNSIDLEQELDSVKFGAMVKTDKVLVLVGAAQEKMEIDGVSVIGISMAAPLMRAMEGKKPGDTAQVGSITHKIISVC
jgi:transcription elongation GreA/GreB family factor